MVDTWLESVLAPATREANPTLAGLLRAMFLANDAHTYVQQAMALRDGDVRPHKAASGVPSSFSPATRTP